ncbi:MAG: LamG-like jellyroll fold domain-containing protein [bacterium]
MAYGWHERVLKSARHFFASQVTGETYRDQPELRARVDGNKELAVYERTMTHPGANPRYLSKGRLIPDQMSTMYDMQSIFFDQVVEEWRFTADPELEKILRPALELHLGYLARVFDPDGNGAYESFINTYLTDNQWYNGGDTAEETAFAYRGHLAARDMARNAGDAEAVKRHEAKLALIRKGFFESVWVKGAGHPGAYREQGGHRRLHPDPWLPAIVHSMDCPGLYNEEQMASVLHFTEYGLQRDKQPLGGVRVWPSNWVPGVWSLRTKSPGEEHHLALAYCQAGLPEAAMEVTRGCHSETGFQSPVPGNFGEPWTGVDFTDFMAPFARTVVSGFFGYRPDRPNGLVTLAPQFPADWDHASLAHPEFKLAYKRQGTTQRLSIELQRESALDVQLPFCGKAVKAATLNGQPIQGTIRPGFGRSVFVVRTPVTQKAELELTVDQELPLGVVQSREVASGSEVELAVEGGRITEVRDEQGVLESVRLAAGKVRARVSVNAGNHRLLALVQMGQTSQWRIFDFQVRDRKAEAYTAEKNLRQAPVGAAWTGLDLAGVFNSRVTELFRQDYMSPRPDTMSARIGRDAYLTWHGAYCRKPSPAVDLSNTWPRRPAPVYDVTLGDLKLGGDFTLEAWVRADLAALVNGRILDWGELVIETSPGSRVVGLYAGKKLIWSYPVLCAERTTHIAAVFRKGKQVAIYLNGETRDKVPQQLDVSELSLGSTLRVGADRNGQRRLLGLVERVAISRQAVTGEQLKGRSLESASLPGAVADWRVTEAAEAQIASGVLGLPPLVRQNVAFKAPKDLPDLVTVVDGKLETPQGARFLWKNGESAFTSLWDNWPRKVTVPVNKKGGSVWLLVAGSTNPMQVRIANAVLRFAYADGVTEELELVPPMNFWSICEFGMSKDYDYKAEAFSLPNEPPPQVQLGNNCRAMVYGWKLRPGVELKSVTLESLSQEVVIGLMGVSICNL